VLDRYGEILVLAGVWGYFYTSGHDVVWSTLLVWAFLSGSLMVSYTRARAEGLRAECAVGMLQRPERVLLLAAGSLAEPLAPGRVLVSVVAVLAVGSNLTAIYRLLHVYGRLSGRSEAIAGSKRRGG